MLVAILQVLCHFVLKLSLILSLAFVVACTVFVIYCAIHGDIKINIIRNETEKENQ